MSEFIRYFSAEDAIKKHDEIIRKSGGIIGILHKGILESTIEHIQYDNYYPTFVDKLTHLVYQVNRQIFLDGSKRSAIALGAYFLEINSFDQLVIDTFIREMENPILLAAQDKINKNDLGAIIHDLVYKLELSDETKMRFIKILKN